MEDNEFPRNHEGGINGVEESAALIPIKIYVKGFIFMYMLVDENVLMMAEIWHPHTELMKNA